MKVVKASISPILRSLNSRAEPSSGYIAKSISDNYALIGILIGVVLVSLSIGPYQNGDTQWEYEATMGIIHWSMPYVNVVGNFMNQPPLGFYVEALFFKAFGLSINVGEALVELFGLGCTVLVYKIGEVLYSKRTGLLAAALFALTPWELVISRTFLIDVQCLFFSLLCLFVGIIAVRKSSFRLFMVSGTVFAAALLTKLYVVFMLIPLLLLFVYHRPNTWRRTFSWLGAFSVPALLSSFLWYQIISGQGLGVVFHQGGVLIHNDNGVVPSFFFALHFIVNYGVGWLFVDAAILSIILCATFKRFQKASFFDLTCLATVLFIVGFNTVLGAVLNLKSAYLDTVKFEYQSLPFLSLLAASLAGKSVSLLKSAKTLKNLKKTTFSVSLLGIMLIAVAFSFNIYYVHNFSTGDHLLFRAEPNLDLGYSLFNPDPIGAQSVLMGLQYLGFAFVLSGLVWMSRQELSALLSRHIPKKHPLEVQGTNRNSMNER